MDVVLGYVLTLSGWCDRKIVVKQTAKRREINKEDTVPGRWCRCWNGVYNCYVITVVKIVFGFRVINKQKSS